MTFKEHNLWEQNINLFSGTAVKNIEETIAFSDVQNPELEKIIGQNQPIDCKN
jgi:peptide chain release factor 3